MALLDYLQGLCRQVEGCACVVEGWVFWCPVTCQHLYLMISGYPSDGIVQVEEEEEAAAESDDHDTYTIDDEYQSRSRRTRPVKPPTIEISTAGARSRRRRAPGVKNGNHKFLFGFWKMI